MKKLVFTLIFLVYTSFVFAQFQLNGSAVSLGSSEYRLTPASNNLSGSIWGLQKIDLSKSFDLNFELSLGSLDQSGADGIVFALQQVSTAAGGSGGGIGYGGISPSVAVEFDTWQNSQYGDPTFDHVALISNGSVDHSAVTSLVSPVQASSNNVNIEDGAYHSVRITWDANAKKMEVFFDCISRFTYTGDIVQNVFANNSMVYWGFTAGTGGSVNEHKVRLSNMSFIKPANQSICKGDTATLNINSFSAINWNPSYNISNTNINNPKVWPAQSTWYKYTLGLNCSQSVTDSVLVSVNPAQPYVHQLGNLTICKGEQVQVNSGVSGKVQWLPSGSVSNDTIANPLVKSVKSEWLYISGKDGCGKTFFDSVFVDVKDGAGKIRDINVMTPNGDGNNDFFEIVDPATVAGFISYHIRIWDRWGRKFYDSTNPAESWNATFSGDGVSSGVYFFVVEYIDNCSKVEHEKTGWLQVIK